MKNGNRFSRRSLLDAAGSMAAVGILGQSTTAFAHSAPPASDSDGEILGQGDFRYLAQRHWGLLDRAHYPVKDCHGMTEDRLGRIILLTNDARNSLIAYEFGLFFGWRFLHQ